MSDAPSGTPTYRIEALADFAKVPPHRLLDCLEEFAEWTCIMRALDAQVREKVPDHPADGAPLIGTALFVWIDDGKRDITATLRNTKGDVVQEFHLADEDRAQPPAADHERGVREANNEFAAQQYRKECALMHEYVRMHDVGGAAGLGHNVFGLVRDECDRLRAAIESRVRDEGRGA